MAELPNAQAFQNFWTRHLQPKAAVLKAEYASRTPRLWASMKWWLILGFPLIPASAISGQKYFPDSAPILFLFPLFMVTWGLIGAPIWTGIRYNRVYREFRPRIVAELVVPLARTLFPDLRHEPARAVDEAAARQSGFFKEGVHMIGADLFSGRVGGVSLQFSELRASFSVLDLDSIAAVTRRNHAPVVVCLLLRAELPRDLPGQVRVTRMSTHDPGMDSPLLAGIRNFAREAARLADQAGFERQGPIHRRFPRNRYRQPLANGQDLGLNPAATGDDAFDAQFRVEASDTGAVRSALSPALRKALLELRQDYGKHFTLSLGGNQGFLMLSHYDRAGVFAPSQTDDWAAPAFFEAIHQDLRLALGLVEALAAHSEAGERPTSAGA